MYIRHMQQVSSLAMQMAGQGWLSSGTHCCSAALYSSAQPMKVHRTAIVLQLWCMHPCDSQRVPTRVGHFSCEGKSLSSIGTAPSLPTGRLHASKIYQLASCFVLVLFGCLLVLCFLWHEHSMTQPWTRAGNAPQCSALSPKYVLLCTL